MVSTARLQQYGVSPVLMEKARQGRLGVSKIRALSVADLVGRYGFDAAAAEELKRCVRRQPIDENVLNSLLERSGHVCCVCKGMKGTNVVVHHIREYELSQDNGYDNLAVLCPNDHDRAHGVGLSIGLPADRIRAAKEEWEREVEQQRVRRAAQAIDIEEDGIDYVNLKRIEEMCLNMFGEIPPTGVSRTLVRSRILKPNRTFDEKYVRKNLSGSFLFDYINSSETNHYRELLVRLSERMTFEDLDAAARSGIRKLSELEGRYTYFIGAVSSKHPGEPTLQAAPLTWRHRTSKVVITWDADARYLMSQSSRSRQGRTNRYLIYGLVRTVVRVGNGKSEVTCGPLLVAQPRIYADRTPSIAWRRRPSA